MMATTQHTHQVMHWWQDRGFFCSSQAAAQGGRHRAGAYLPGAGNAKSVGRRVQRACAWLRWQDGGGDL